MTAKAKGRRTCCARHANDDLLLELARAITDRDALIAEVGRAVLDSKPQSAHVALGWVVPFRYYEEQTCYAAACARIKELEGKA